MVTALLQRCSKPAPTIPSDTLYISTCPGHGAKFDQEGQVIATAYSGTTLALKQYDANINIENNTITIYGDENTELLLSNNIAIGDISHTDSNEIDSKGLLLYRKSENEIIVLSRSCGHQGNKINPFEEI